MPEKAILKRSERLSPPSNTGADGYRDRKYYFSKILIVFILGSIKILSFGGLFSQIVNQEQAYENLVLNYLKLDQRTIKEATGSLTEKMKFQIEVDSSGEYSFSVEPPLIRYDKISRTRFVRTLQTDLVFTDSTEHRTSLTLPDTLPNRQLPAASSTAYEWLRGSDPRLRTKYLYPGLGIGGGIAVIISLFYIRSSAP